MPARANGSPGRTIAESLNEQHALQKMKLDARKRGVTSSLLGKYPSIQEIYENHKIGLNRGLPRDPLIQSNTTGSIESRLSSIWTNFLSDPIAENLDAENRKLENVRV
ncbi:MAG: hypothetical protein AB3N64_05020 [Puniceicoccaceae bacterium]